MQMLAKSSFTVASVMLCSAISLTAFLAPINVSAEEGSSQTTLDGHNFVLAARYGHENVIINLLNGGADIELKDELGNTALIVAAAENKQSILKFLIEQGADVNAQSNDGTSALMNAAMYGHLEVADLLLKAGSKIDLKKTGGETALIGAVQYGHLAMIELLLSQGADANAVTKGAFNEGGGKTPLMFAAQHGLKGAQGDWNKIAATLLKYGAKTNLTRANGDTALTIAQWHGFDDIKATLEKAGARDETHYAALSSEDSLIKAAKINDQVKIQLLLSQSTNVNYRDSNTGVTPLLTAVYYGNMEVVRTMVKHGANVNHVPWGLKEQRIASSSVTYKERELLRTISRSDTALLVAIHKNHAEIASYLIDHGAKIAVGNRKGETPTLIAARNGNADLMALLLKHGADQNRALIEKKVDRFITRIHKKEKRPSLLIEAARGGHIEVIKVLLAAGADVDIQNGDGVTALFKAAEQGHADAVELLLANQAAPNLFDNTGRTPLMIASRNGYKSIVEQLISHDADVNAIEQLDPASHRDISIGGMTALIYASRGGHAEIAAILLKNGADRRLSSNTGETALGAAKKNGFKKIEQLLAGSAIDD